MESTFESKQNSNLYKYNFENLYDAASHVLQLLSEFIPINTFFVAINDNSTNYILKVLNRHTTLLLEGSESPFNQTYCSLVVKEKVNPVIINDITKNPDTANMDITKLSGMGSFIGIPITDKKGTVYGTVCAMDSNPFEFKREHSEVLVAFAGILSYIVDLENAEKKISSDLVKAAKIQQSVLPPNFSDKNIEIEGVYYPAMHLSGDMYHWVQIDENRYGVLLIDVMGHGVSASLISMALRSLMTNLIKRVSDPVKVFRELNTHLFNLLPNKIISFATGIYIVIDTMENTIDYISAGHPPCILHVDGQLLHLESSSTALGLIESPTFTSQSITYINEYQMLLYTDGLLELTKEQSIQENFDVLSSKLLNAKLSVFTWLEDLIQKNGNYPDDVSLVEIHTPRKLI